MSNQDTPLTQKYKLYITNDGLDSNTSDITKRICIFNQSNTKITYNSKEMKLSLNGVSFRRRIYEPGHIEAEIQIGYSDSSNTPKLAELQTMFIKKKVDLEIAIEKVKKDTVLAKNYYIHEICPLYSSTSKDTSIYVRLSIFSMDKLMTLNKYSQAFLGRKFGTGIMIPSATDFSLKNEKTSTFLPSDPASSISSFILLALQDFSRLSTFQETRRIALKLLLLTSCSYSVISSADIEHHSSASISSGSSVNTSSLFRR